MGQRKVINEYYSNIDNLTSILNSLTNCHRLLVADADELNKITLAKKKDVRNALKRAEDIGKIIDEIVDSLEYNTEIYKNYVKLKGGVLKNSINTDSIRLEIEEELKSSD